VLAPQFSVLCGLTRIVLRVADDVKKATALSTGQLSTVQPRPPRPWFSSVNLNRAVRSLQSEVAVPSYLQSGSSEWLSFSRRRTIYNKLEVRYYKKLTFKISTGLHRTADAPPDEKARIKLTKRVGGSKIWFKNFNTKIRQKLF